MSRREDWRDALIILACLLAAAALMLLMTGCFGNRLSDQQAQALSNARAGATAAQQKRDAIAHEADPVRANLLAQELLDDLTRGMIGFTLAASANADLPAPTFQPAMLLEQPTQAHEYGEQGVRAGIRPPPGVNAVFWGGIGTLALTGIGLALKLGRNIPGVGGTVGAILSPLWDHFVSDKVKMQDVAKAVAPIKQATEAIDDSLDISIAYGERLAAILTNAGLTRQVEDAKLRAAFLAEKLGVGDEIKRRLEMVRMGAVTLPSLPADSRVPPASFPPAT